MEDAKFWRRVCLGMTGSALLFGYTVVLLNLMGVI